jgi:hypothetical protein
VNNRQIGSHIRRQCKRFLGCLSVESGRRAEVGMYSRRMEAQAASMGSSPPAAAFIARCRSGEAML